METKQIIYDEWISNSVPPVDCRNDRECMKIKKNISMQIYNKLENETPLIEKMNKRGILNILQQEEWQHALYENFNLNWQVNMI